MNTFIRHRSPVYQVFKRFARILTRPEYHHPEDSTGYSEPDDRYAFIAEWYDPNAALVRRYQFIYYVKDSQVEMFDIKNHRLFLKRTKIDEIRLEDLYVGKTLNLLARQLQLVDYGDDYTKMKLLKKNESTLGMIKPDCINKMGQIIDIIYQNGFSLTNLKMCRLDRSEALEFYEEHKGKSFLDALLHNITSGPVIAFQLLGGSAIPKWREILGPTDPAVARTEASNSIRARFGTDSTKNACHGSDSPSSADRETQFFFQSSGKSRRNTALFKDCTCCIIKPHAVASGLTGQIITAIQDAGFQISAVQMFHLDKAIVEEFYEVYKGVVGEYNSMVAELTSGGCIAMEIRAQDAAKTFREMVGPADPEIARHLRPRTLRAMFGVDKTRNAVHCTDLEDDGLLEVEYFFRILDR